jgi:hypothetical protein
MQTKKLKIIIIIYVKLFKKLEEKGRKEKMQENKLNKQVFFIVISINMCIESFKTEKKTIKN